MKYNNILEIYFKIIASIIHMKENIQISAFIAKKQ